MKLALITGASSGIGEAAAILFAENGYTVVATGRNQERLDAVKAKAPQQIHTIACDLNSAEACEKLIADVAAQFGQLDVLVNSAGIIMRKTAADTSDDDWRQTMTVNLDVPFYLSRAAVPHLAKSKGRIVNVASYWGVRGGGRALAYTASKAGLIGLTKAMALDHAAEGITVNAVCPGDVVTPMLEREIESLGLKYNDAIKDWHADYPTGRVTEAAEVAAMILYLASDAARQVTGQALLIDGGASV